MSIITAPLVVNSGVKLEVREWPFIDKGGMHTAIEILHEGKRVLMSYYKKPEVRQLYLDMAAEAVHSKRTFGDLPDAHIAE